MQDTAAVSGDATAETGETHQPVSRADRREAQTARIMDAAKKCFVRSGFQGASMNEICREAEMSPGALYRYFPSKEAMIEAIAEADRAEDAKILAEMTGNPDVIDGFVSAAISHLMHIHNSGAAPLFTEIRAEGMRNEAVCKCCDASMQHTAEAIRDYLQAAIDRGEIEPRAPLDILLPVMMAIGEGLVLADLPSKGIPVSQIENLMRAAVTANLRPVTKAGKTIEE